MFTPHCYLQIVIYISFTHHHIPSQSLFKHCLHIVSTHHCSHMIIYTSSLPYLCLHTIIYTLFSHGHLHTIVYTSSITHQHIFKLVTLCSLYFRVFTKIPLYLPQAMHDPDMMPCIRDKTIRQVVQSMARFMAAYFSNNMIFIFPPHNPAPLPAVHFETFNASKSEL